VSVESTEGAEDDDADDDMLTNTHTHRQRSPKIAEEKAGNE